MVIPAQSRKLSELLRVTRICTHPEKGIICKRAVGRKKDLADIEALGE
ncbi:MAG: hypothetical protein HZA49_01690 [Planctomycetes bacterium]|nr:hypothetical protein [Planctomycetota bacterium]